MKVRPKRGPGEAPAQPLSAEERFVLARIDGNLSVGDIATLTGMETQEVEQIVSKLATSGAVDLEATESSGFLPDPGSAPELHDPGETSLAEFAAVLGLDPSAFAAAEPARAKEMPVEEHLVETKSGAPPPPSPSEASNIPILTEADEVHEEEEAIPELTDEHVVSDEETEEEKAAAAQVDAEEKDAATAERNYREVYMAKFAQMPADARIHYAHTVSGADLFALCFDPDPKIIAAILENHTAGLDHARMIAAHHRTGTGLEIVSRRQEYVRDSLVERRLLRNPMSGDFVIQRIMAGKRILVVYKIAIDREIPERTRVKSRMYLRKSWQMAAPEDRADLLLRTEARCLILMTGCTFDSKTTQILCGKSFASAMFVQNIAKFGASPPALLAHLYKQAFVRKSPPLRKMLLQHPNMPGEVKRNA